jgi:hypothetical protein
VGRVRLLLVPLALVGAAVLAVRPSPEPAPEPPDPPVLLEDPFASRTSEQVAVLDDLWAAWGRDLQPAADGLPPELLGLDFGEALYVLLTVRAAQLAEAVAADPAAPLADAVARAGLAPAPADVTEAVVPEVPGCVSVEHLAEPNARTFFGWSAAPDGPAPTPVSPLEERLLRTARVGLGEVDRAACGQAVGYSPLAQQALVALAPELLPD